MNSTTVREFVYSLPELTRNRKYINLDAVDKNHNSYRSQSRLFTRNPRRLAGMLETINHNTTQIKDGSPINIVVTETTLTLYEESGVSVLFLKFLYSSVGTVVLTSSTTCRSISGSGLYEFKLPLVNITPIGDGKRRLLTVNYKA